MSTQKPLIIYHRGRHGSDIRIKENTLRAFLRAVKEGAAMIEFDVRMGLRIAHDEDDDSSLPSLCDALQSIAARSSVNIEIKSPRAAPSVVGVLDDLFAQGVWKEEQIVLSSFHHKTVVLMKQLFPRVTVGVVNDGVLMPAYIDWLKGQGIDNLHLEWSNIYMDIEDGCRMRDRAFEQEMSIWTWTVNTKEVFDVVANYGVKAVFTDKPELFR